MQRRIADVRTAAMPPQAVAVRCSNEQGGSVDDAGRTDQRDFDVLISGMVFLDIVFTDLPCPPAPGTEVWTGGMGSSPGGIANLAVAESSYEAGTQTESC